MAEAIGSVLAYAVGVGISPIPIIAVILVLFSRRANVNGPMFLLGWVLGLSAVVAVMTAIAVALDVGDDATVDDGVGWTRLLFGVLLGVAAARKWSARPSGDGAEPEMPGWMAGVEDLSPARTTGLALALSANPKNLVLALGATTSVAQTPASTVETVVALAVFVAIGSALVIAAVVAARLGGDAATARLEGAKAWLTLHNSAVMAVLFAVFAAVLIGQGLGVR